MSRLTAAALLLCLLAGMGVANAKPLRQQQIITCDQRGCGPGGGEGVAYSARGHADPRPRAWCGWWLRQQLGVADRAFNQARRWARYGTKAHGPAPGVIAVWPHHVGLVTGVPGPGRIVLKSGNDGHAVRERERSSRGVIAWRWAYGVAMQ
jgi:hypothetical protein